jgi:uncharacterized protein (DUF2235 family)
MAKNILIFADGTGNEGGLLPDESRTNIYKLFRATRTGPDTSVDPKKQIAFYIPGIGTTVNGKSGWLAQKQYTVQQMFGIGFTERVVQCYAAAISVWQPGDRIYLFGFSRGAYIARCAAHVLELFGIPTTQADATTPISLKPSDVAAIARRAVKSLYKWGLPRIDDTQRQKAIDEFVQDHQSQRGAQTGAVPYFIGVFDTVAAVGWHKIFPKTRYDYHLPRETAYARHAMAIDEFRKDFERVAWGGSGTVRTGGKENELHPFEQIWFAGNHADIGGSYPENESRLSDIALEWMAEIISNELPPERQIIVDRRYLALYPDCEGMMHDECMVGVGGTPLRWFPAERNVPTDARLHPSVIERLSKSAVRNFVSFAPYRPATLRDHPDAKPFFAATQPSVVAPSPTT